jgi:hypothetical protein
MPRHIPAELLALIFQHFTNKAALSNLCLVSRAFRHEAQRILYHTIRLPSDYDRLVSWCDATVANPHLAMQVYSLSLPTSFRHRQLFTAKLDTIRQELRHVVKRALSLLLRLARLHTFHSEGARYLSFDILCGHPFRLQVFEEEPQSPRSLNHWLEFLSEQPGIRHWRSDVYGHAVVPNILPLLTSADIYLPMLTTIARCPMIRALRVTRRPWAPSQPSELKVFTHTLTSLSLECSEYPMVDLKVVRDAVPNIKFLGLHLQDAVSPLVQSLSEFY